MAGTEERLTDEGAQPTPRRRRAVSAGRLPEDRSLGERGLDARQEVKDDREIGPNDDDAFATFMESLDQSVLPDLPKLPGFHVCWLTTTNLRDTIAWRERVGYTPVKRSELRNWHTPNLKTAEGDDDLVRVNEMVAYKLPRRLYLKYMDELHNKRPLAEEEKLKARTDAVKQNLAMSGSAVTEEGDGTAGIVQRPSVTPTFVE